MSRDASFLTGQPLPASAEAGGSEAVRRLRDAAPHATHLLALLGDPVDSASLATFSAKYGTDWFDEEVATQQFGRLWRQAHGRSYWELLELLVAESWVSARPAEVARHLPPGMTFDKTLHTIRGAVALGLYSHAKSLGWQEPLTFARALRVAERYLLGVVRNSHLSRPGAIKQFQGRLGVSVILQSRFSDLPIEALRVANRHLRESIAAGNNSPDAFAYLAEGLLRCFDITGDDAYMQELMGCSTQQRRQGSPALTALTAEAWLRRSHAARSSAGQRGARDQARSLVQPMLETLDILAFCRAAIIIGICDAEDTADASLPLQGLRLPFGLQRQGPTWIEVDRPLTEATLKSVAAALSAAPTPLLQQPLLRRLLASTRSGIARAIPVGGRQEDRRSHLRAAVELRGANDRRGALRDPESGLENAIDLFQLYRLSGDGTTLLEAIRATLALVDFDQAWPTPLLVLARELSHLGRLPLAVAMELRRTPLSHARGALSLVLADDPPGLFALAAKRALASREVDRKNLGGRHGVFLAEDYSGIVSETFVFKPTTRVLAEREDQRGGRIAGRLKQAAMTRSYSLAKTLAQSPLPDDDVLRSHGYDTIVAREFHPGVLLDEAVDKVDDLGRRCHLVEQVVRFLALIHGCESSGRDSETFHMRRDLRKRELGRWLVKGLRVPDADAVFERWFTLFPKTVPPLARRDAHARNWLVTATGQIVALDFEAAGWRPAGYELAQLTDDQPILPVDDAGWATRTHLLGVYHAALADSGVKVPRRELRKAYEASLIARAVGLLTDPKPATLRRDHGEALLRHLADNARDPAARDLAAQLSTYWSVRRGTSTGGDAGTVITEARRRHLSRAMAYELRHGERVLLDKGGWAYVAAVSDALRQVGLDTTRAELLAAAGAIDEHRFELNGARIRARYGHTRRVSIAYQEVAAPVTLYHGTATHNLNNIFSLQQGLLPMGRHWVHLSSDPTIAMLTARRHGPGVLLSTRPGESLEIYAAGGNVFLAASVPPDKLRIVTPTEIFLQGLEEA